MTKSQPPNSQLLTRLLKEVSRSFYLTLAVLPAPVRPQIGLAYLLARTTDTIADTGLVPLEQRIAALRALRDRILGTSTAPLNFGELARQQGSPAERVLLENIDESLALLAELPPADILRVRDVLATIMSGQELDLRRFAHSANGTIIALETAAELDDYTYRVAGCVGEFWTKMCRAHLFPGIPLDEPQLLRDGIRFGKGLQLVNILRDLPADLKNGRCYLPLEKLAAARLVPETLLSPANEAKFLPLYRGHLDQAAAHLAAGWRYTNTLPYGQFRLRLACAWPVLIGVRTLGKLRAANVLELSQRVKVRRAEVWQIIFGTLAAGPFPPLWRKLYPSAGNAIDSSADLP